VVLLLEGEDDGISDVGSNNIGCVSDDAGSTNDNWDIYSASGDCSKRQDSCKGSKLRCGKHDGGLKLKKAWTSQGKMQEVEVGLAL